jgi:hypothetical protein
MFMNTNSVLRKKLDLDSFWKIPGYGRIFNDFENCRALKRGKCPRNLFRKMTLELNEFGNLESIML